jgi:Predicted solute binding protein
MSRIRNRLRFQSPEERVLNGLLIVLLGVLAVVGVSKWRDDHAVGATEVRGIQLTRPTPPRVVASTSSTTTTTPGPDPQLVWYLVATAARSSATPKPAANPGAPLFGFPPTPSTSTTTTTRPVTTTTTTTRPVTTTTTTTRPVTTTTTTQPPLIG